MSRETRLQAKNKQVINDIEDNADWLRTKLVREHEAEIRGRVLYYQSRLKDGIAFFHAWQRALREHSHFTNDTNDNILLKHNSEMDYSSIVDGWVAPKWLTS